MKKGVKIFTAAILGLAAVACSSPEKMAEQAELVTVTSDPAILEVVAGHINANVTVSFPAGYFHAKAILEVTPVLVYDGGELAMEPYYFQGEKVSDNYQVISNKEGGVVTKPVNFNYVEGVEQSQLELRGVVSYKTKSWDLPVKKVADGAITTYMLVGKKGFAEPRPDGYQEIIKETAEGQILYQINNATVRNSELKGESVKNWLAEVEGIKADERRVIVGTDIVAYASPDGKEALNNKLSDNRSSSASKAYDKITKKAPIDAPVNVQSVGEDWEGFQDLVSASSINDKELILRVLSMYGDPAVREQEIKNMSAVYKELAKEVLPELRRARFIANVEYTNYSNAELLALIEENIDVLDETALLRAATLVEALDAKVAIYNKAIEKYSSDAAQLNLACAYLNAGETAKGEAALAKVAVKDEYYKNAAGVVALQKAAYSEAIAAFKACSLDCAKENLGVCQILTGQYEAAAASLANAQCPINKGLSLILVKNYAGASSVLTCDCPVAAYLRAVIAARQGDAAGVKSNLEAASKCEKLAARAEKDIEFAQFK